MFANNFTQVKPYDANRKPLEMTSNVSKRIDQRTSSTSYHCQNIILLAEVIGGGLMLLLQDCISR